MEDRYRCEWARKHPLLTAYHDSEWGVPVHDDYKHFEFLVLDAFQAGLSWLTVLKKRENFRRAFDGFDFYNIANYREDKINELLKDASIIRNRLKIHAAVHNAAAMIHITGNHGSFDDYVWSLMDYTSLNNKWKSMSEIPASSPESDRMSRELKKQGFRFVGTTICYAYMQAAGMVNDHETGCFRYDEVMNPSSTPGYKRR